MSFFIILYSKKYINLIFFFEEKLIENNKYLFK